MAIRHRFINELTNLEQHQTFCGTQVQADSNILIIGTFNPDDESCEKQNIATWFYGRTQSKFWRYLPQALTNQSLHPSDGHQGHPQTWKDYCIANRIVIIDLIKSIEINDILPDFGDNEVECKINHDLTNTNHFGIDSAFNKIRFNKIIYSLAWTDTKIRRLRRIRDIINGRLLANGCINNLNQIKYCLTPSRNNAYPSWGNAVNH